MTKPARAKTHFCCYYNEDCGDGTARVCDASIEPPKGNPGGYYGAADIKRIAISVATADAEDGEPPGHFSFDMRANNIPARLSDKLFDVRLRAYFTKDELTRLHAVFGLLLGISAP